MDEWISVDDEMPETDRVVIICFPGAYDGKPVYAWGGICGDGDERCWGVVNTHWGSCNAGGLNETIEVDDDYPVTHWMPLPAPPPAQSETERE